LLGLSIKTLLILLIVFFKPREVHPLVSKILITPLIERNSAVDYEKIIDAFANLDNCIKTCFCQNLLGPEIAM
jgi:hypothetical protein